jgi:pimeloyl-ACP methyl ester carboxylesterase
VTASSSVNDRSIVAADGTRIAYRVEGSGTPLVLTNGLTTTTTFWRHLRPLLLRRHTVVTWDLPGHGRSSPAMSPWSATIAAQPSFVAAVMDAARIGRALQIGWSAGCQIALETYRQVPERCSGLALLLGPAEHVLRTTRLPVDGAVLSAFAHLAPPRVFAQVYRAAAYGWRVPGTAALGRWFGIVGKATTNEDVALAIGHMTETHAPTVQALLRSAESHSAYDVLPKVRVPLLIVTGDVDPFAPSELVGVPMHRAAPGSEFVRLPHGSHTALLDHADSIASIVEAFADRVFAVGATPARPVSA